MGKIPEWDPDAGGIGYVYARMADHLQARVDAGEIPPGARLPGERELATEYGVALGTTRRAIQELRDRGVVATLPAKGTFVVPPEDRPGK